VNNCTWEKSVFDIFFKGILGVGGLSEIFPTVVCALYVYPTSINAVHCQPVEGGTARAGHSGNATLKAAHAAEIAKLAATIKELQDHIAGLENEEKNTARRAKRNAKKDGSIVKGILDQIEGVSAWPESLPPVIAPVVGPATGTTATAPLSTGTMQKQMRREILRV
jgi:hypothetical protein